VVATVPLIAELLIAGLLIPERLDAEVFDEATAAFLVDEQAARLSGIRMRLASTPARASFGRLDMNSPRETCGVETGWESADFPLMQE
jgi:hypothetical protein